MEKKLLALFALLGCTVVMAQSEPPKPPSKSERLKHVAEKINKEINLTAAQKTKLEAAYSEFFDGMEKLRVKEGKPTAPPPPPPPANREAAEKLSAARDAKIKAVLTETQFRKYAAMEKSLRPPGPGNKEGKPLPPPAPKQ
ncbi:MAG: hypothetical protein HYU70_07785 [Bacteroidetes bacterium]|nr:hypothetical protein [Bacteroidota bacterium]